MPSLETLRPRIVDWLRFQEITQLQERLERDARIERLREQDKALEPGDEVTAPADAEPTTGAPDAGRRRAAGQAPPPFPFPMGPGGVQRRRARRRSAAPQPAAQPAPAPAEATPAGPTQ